MLAVSGPVPNTGDRAAVMGSEQEKKAQDPEPSSHRVEADRDLSAWLRTVGLEYGRAGRDGQQPNAPNGEPLR